MKFTCNNGKLALAGAFALLCAGIGAAAQAQNHPPAKVIGVAKANTIAAKHFHGKVVGKTPLEDEEGTWQYGVMVQSGKTLREVMVNAKTGHIDSSEVTSAAKEKKEMQADKDKMAHPKMGKGAMSSKMSK